jgi:hypothetical protein
MTIINKKCWEPNFKKTKCKCCVAGENQVCAPINTFTETTFIKPPLCTGSGSIKINSGDIFPLIGTIEVKNFIATATGYDRLLCNNLILGWIGPDKYYRTPLYLETANPPTDDFVNITTVRPPNSDCGVTIITCKQPITLYCFTRPDSTLYGSITNSSKSKKFSQKTGLLIGQTAISTTTDQTVNSAGSIYLNVASSTNSTVLNLETGSYAIQLGIMAASDYYSGNDIMYIQDKDPGNPLVGFYLALGYVVKPTTECY